MKRLLIYNAHIVTPLEVIPFGSVEIKEGRIVAVSRENPPSTGTGNFSSYLDAEGKLLMPGLIDLHTDAIEKEIHPRPGANFPVNIAFRELERKMSGCGITTVYHSIYLGYQAAEEYATTSRVNLFETVAQLCKSKTILNNRIHLRYEITSSKDVDTCLTLIENGYVQLLSFMDHTPGQGQYAGDKYRRYLKADSKNKAEIERIFRERITRNRIIQGELQRIAQACLHYQIPIASHDDDHAVKVIDMHNLGCTICEFPINFEAAHQGRLLNMYTVGGAANILRGGSLSGNLNVQEAVKSRLINTLCSDYYPPSLLHAIFKLEQEKSLSLPEATRLATLHPAEAVGLGSTKGSIQEGKDADLILVGRVEGTYVVSHTFIQGRLTARAHHETRFDSLPVGI
ncbi:alpha-D-ribose 1-methylphosphonate 5-triphosphate diphosphatase [Cyclobacterium xiamenense]|uniref:Alpha-D-ribose 1-methylphosphonate 5-triphosphate diphosphatase n=1 Tax=Cyclobacterium xiamenense TaxID=1297121 RepID=A0A1H6TT85_9BACT|nr:alpha-D-ribose 1-methylphosphonate 5-triphosphate diphosphatase [Cyclobacterium xiamenense]SEI79415.1 alpha-D-ribose 1-methylphosphonate 5-triphosphate diphosphatase [Cyclobacterium xiamenense]